MKIKILDEGFKNITIGKIYDCYKIIPFKLGEFYYFKGDDGNEECIFDQSITFVGDKEKEGLVVYCEKYGVFLGNFLDFSFWSKIDRAGQLKAPVFKDIDNPLKFFKKGGDFDRCLVPVNIEECDEGYILLDKLKKIVWWNSI